MNRNLIGGVAMDRKQMQPTPAGRVSQQNLIQEGGVAMKWEVRFISYDYTADEEGEKLWRHVGELSKPELALEIEEECDCGDRPLHNNGGHYHYWWQIYKLDDEHYLVYMNNSREAFTPWEQGYVHVYNGELEYSIWTETIQETDAYVCGKEEVFK